MSVAGVEHIGRITLDAALLATAVIISLGTAVVGAGLITLSLPPVTGTPPAGVCGGVITGFEPAFHGLFLPAKLFAQVALVWLAVRWAVAHRRDERDVAVWSLVEKFGIRLLAVSVLWMLIGILLITLSVSGFGLVEALSPGQTSIPPCDDPPSELDYGSGSLFLAFMALLELAIVALAWHWTSARRPLHLGAEAQREDAHGQDEVA